MPKKPANRNLSPTRRGVGYDSVLIGVVDLLESARRASARTVNAIMTATYWEVGRRIMEYEQEASVRAEYGTELLKRLGKDLSDRFGRGFGWRNLYLMRAFYQTHADILQTVSAKSSGSPRTKRVQSKVQTVSAKSGHENLRAIGAAFPLPWSHYVRLLSVDHEPARQFYEAEALRGGWSVRQLDRQINTKFYERTALSKDKASMLSKGQRPKPEDAVTPEEEIKDPLVLEFLNLKDEYSEHDLEEAIIHRLEAFLLELGGDFAFVGRQRRLRVGDQWFRIDLLFFHRRLRCLVIIDLKLSAFTPGDVGQMNMYLNYARAHWTHEGENPPVGLILSADTSEPVARYAMEGLTNKMLAAEYRTSLPAEEDLQREIERTKQAFEQRRIARTGEEKSPSRQRRVKRT